MFSYDAHKLYRFLLFQSDPLLENHRRELIVDAGRKLDQARMVRFDERTGYFASTDQGRIASHFYIKYDTVEVGNNSVSFDDLFDMLQST